MLHKIDITKNNPQALTCSVVQITEMLGMYRAEMARILNLRCEDIGKLFDGKRTLVFGRPEWDRAELLLEFYNLLQEKQQGNDVEMYHWLRAQNDHLGTTPLLKMVDNDEIEKVIAVLEDQQTNIN